ncbi:MAG TPA: hypothetical protein VNM92_16985 [Thermoanaerobaculia bacterium]|nr:hypothetical protein [Thermoanaerobaculia bacterium]
MSSTLTSNRLLAIAALAFGAASLLHHIHNAEYLSDYPNLPAWLSRARVYAAWIGVTSIGLFGYALIRFGYRLAGLSMLGFYGLAGLYGLAHYSIAPISAHTVSMNLTIWLEVATALILLTVVTRCLINQTRQKNS